MTSSAAPLYREIGLLAEGGMALVQSAVREADGAAVVIKRVRPPLCFDASYLRLFADEAAVHGSLDGCAHVVRLLDRGEDEQGPYLVFEHVDGTDLGVLLDRALVADQALDVELVLAFARPLFAALAYVHEAKKDGAALDVVHRDISPGNVLLGEDGCVKLADFGIAAFRLKSEVTVVGELKGKFAYMAPEQTRGERVDARADLFAAGIVLWESLQNRRLFDAPTDADVVQKVREQAAPPLDAARVGADLCALVAALLEKDPAARPLSARKAKDTLDSIILARGLDEGLSRVVARAVRLAPRRTPTPAAPDVRRRTQRVLGAPVPTVVRPKRPVPAAVVVVIVLVAAALALGGVRPWSKRVDVVVETLPPLPPLPPATAPIEVLPVVVAPPVVNDVRVEPPKVARNPKLPIVKPVVAPAVVVAAPVAADGFGRLSLNAEPWARVSVDGVVVDEETPLVGFSLPAGRHTVVLENPIYDLKKSFVVDIVKDAHERRFIDLQR
ncbi:MAG: serine/threonine-protein kinase [Deltaproteobacteria bacterium]|nr:serine/threonine-protein kinase [Deltaproteobacteria bacterium]